MDLETLIKLNDKYLDKLIGMTGKGITTGESDPITIHVTAVKIRELYNELKGEIKSQIKN